MAPLPDYVSGTITLANGSAAFTGTGTGWLAASFREGDTILGIEDNPGVVYVIESITDNDAGTLTQPWDGPSGTYEYRMRYLSDGQRVTAQARQLIELLGNGNLAAMAGLSGTPNTLPMFTGTGAMIEVPRTDLVSGAAYDVQVDDLAARDAYDSMDAGFAVLVSDVGDGRSAVYSKASNASGDWTDAAYITGPVGDTGPEGPQGTPGSGFNWIGAYDPANSYATDDVVRSNGSTFIAVQAVPSGEAPSGAYPPVDTAYWQVAAVRGQDGTGTGNVVGPASAVDNRIAVFDGTTGKLIKDGGVTVNEMVPADGSITNAKLANMEQATIKGRAAGAGTGAPTDLSAAQVLEILNVTPPRGHLFNLTISNNASDPTNDIDISEGEATSSDGESFIRLESPLTKRLDAPWAAGSGSGGLDSGSIANTTYHVHVILNETTGVVDALFSTSVSAPILPSGYTKSRRIGSIIRKDGSILGFLQNGDSFVLAERQIDLDQSPPSSTSAQTVALTVPLGLTLEAEMSVQLVLVSTGGTRSVLITALSLPDTVPGSSNYHLSLSSAASGTFRTSGYVAAFTNLSSQVRVRIDGTEGTVLRIQTNGWSDLRGRCL